MSVVPDEVEDTCGLGGNCGNVFEFGPAFCSRSAVPERFSSSQQ
jgi:hypothetical protein